MPEILCVFCGQPIEEGAERSGRPPHAAHVACADDALASDAHWDSIASASGDPTPGEPPGDAAPKGERARAGCLAITAAALVALGMLISQVAVAT
jgi:hypothetical protein